MRSHFGYRHPQDEVVVDGECLPRCGDCGMQVAHTAIGSTRHMESKTCRQMADMRSQHMVAAKGTRAVEHVFTAYGKPLRRVTQFKYLGRILATDDADSAAIRRNISRARGVWGRIATIIAKEGVPPIIAGMFYQAVVASVLLFGSETWVAAPHDLRACEGFHVEACRRLTGMRPRKQGDTWVYPKSAAVLRRARVRTIAAQIQGRRAKIFESVVGRPIMNECLGSRRRRGSPAHLNWWEQKMDLDLAAEEEEDDEDGWPLPPPRQDGDMEGADDPIV